jgi:hypothetical protein
MAIRERADTYRHGRNALSRLKRGRDYLDWIDVARAVWEARDEALEQIGMAGSNLPPSLRLGGGYSKAYSAILKREGLEDEFIDRTTRNQLFEIIANLPSIEAHRDLLSPAERAKLNHPSAVLRHFKRSGAVHDDRAARRPSPSKADNLLEELTLAREEIERLRECNAELEGAHDRDQREIEHLREHIAELQAARERDRATEAIMRYLNGELAGIRAKVVAIEDGYDFDHWLRARRR